jgi:hypothetical protein
MHLPNRHTGRGVFCRQRGFGVVGRGESSSVKYKAAASRGFPARRA